MAGRWYCKISGQTTDPLSPEELKALADQGKVGPNDLVRHGDEGPWIPAICVKGLLSGAGSAESLPEATAKPVAEMARRGPAKYAGKQGAKPPAPRRAKSLPVARPMDEPPAAAPKAGKVAPAPPRAAPPRPAPAPRPVGPLVVDPVAESATHRALGRTVASPRKRARNNLLAIGILSVLAVGLGIGGIVLVASRNGADDTAADAKTGAKDSAKAPETAASSRSDSAASTSPDSITWVDASKAAIHRDQVRVQIRSVGIGTPPGETALVRAEYLLIAIEVQNTSPAKNLTFTSWSSVASTEEPVRLTDQTGKVYHQKLQPGDEREGEPKAKETKEGPATPAPAVSGSPADAMLGARYAAAGVPTFVVFQDGQIVDEVPRAGAKSRLQDAISRHSPPLRTGPQRLSATEAIEEVLVFDAPGSDVKYLRLSLPAAAFGSKGTLNFTIPGAMIGKDEPRKPSRSPSDSDPTKPKPKPKPSEKPPGGAKTAAKTPEVPQEKVDPGELEGEKVIEEINKGVEGKENDGFESMTKKPPALDPNGGDRKGKPPRRPRANHSFGPAESTPPRGDRDRPARDPFK